MGSWATYPSLEGRIVLVTGGATGIGAAVVEGFAAQRSKVVFLDILEDAAEELNTRLEKSGLGRAAFFRCDLTSIEQLQNAVEQVRAQFGTVDVLVNNAANDARHSIDEVTSQSWDEMMAVNLKHQFFMTQAVVPAMRRAGRGSIINMSSISWVIPSTSVPVYVTAKAAIVGMTRTLAHELGGDNIRVNCVMPGAIATERQRRLWLTEEYKAEVLRRQALKRLIEPEEVARLVLFLASDDSAAITNQSYVIDGGWV
ncbi:MAG TPA: SDR family NAD(P)-dependent oxidoreductase [Edaphobacter sp.]|nr:SDR family NAD(P)-dependent oxidoreductase [Edaphobacter sp.]